MEKWKSKQSGRTLIVLGDEKEGNKMYRFFYFEDTPNVIAQWDLSVYGDPWEDNFEKVLDNPSIPA